MACEHRLAFLGLYGSEHRLQHFLLIFREFCACHLRHLLVLLHQQILAFHTWGGKHDDEACALGGVENGD